MAVVATHIWLSMNNAKTKYMVNRNNNNNKGLRVWDEVIVCTHPRGIDANIQPLYALKTVHA
jgi:hypothetical protein